MRHYGAILLAVLLACGGATRKSATAPHIPDEEDSGPASPVPIVRLLAIGADGFEAPYPGTPLPVRAKVLPAAVPLDQQPVQGARVEAVDRRVIHAVGSYVDPDGIEHLALVHVRAGARPRLDDILWFERTGGAAGAGAWRVWQERFGHASLLAFHGERGAIAAVRFVEGIQRVREVALDARTPMVMIERNVDATDTRPAQVQLFGVVGGRIESLLELDAKVTAVEVAPPGLVVRSLPELSATCAPRDLLDAGCAVAETTFAWTNDMFVRGPDHGRLWKLTDTKVPVALPQPIDIAPRPGKRDRRIDFEDIELGVEER